MMPLRAAVITLLALAGLALAGPAAHAAAGCTSAPGTSAVDQYCESIPAAGGDTAAGTPPSDGSVDLSGLPAATRRALARPGTPTDAAIARLVPSGPSASRGTGPASRATAQAPQTVSESPLRAVADSVEQGPSLGGGLPVVLIALSLGVGGALWIRSRAT